MTLLEATLKAMQEHGQSVGDVLWVGGDDGHLPWEEFKEMSGNRKYVVRKDLVVVFKDESWLERDPYEGVYRWIWKTFPKFHPESLGSIWEDD